MRRSLSFLVLAGTFITCAQAQIPVTDDAFTSSAAPSANYGVSLGLVVQSPTATGTMTSPAELSGFSANTYLKFDLSALPANALPGNIAKANLRLYVDFVVSAGTFDVYQAAGPWDEATLTAKNAPGIVGSPINSSPISVSKALKYLDIDITSAFANGLPANGLVLVPSVGSNIFASFDSKENPLTSHDPNLTVSVSDASSAQLQQEIKRATLAENTIATNLSTETTRAMGAENTLTTSLNAEVTRAKSAEASLNAGLSAETTRAQGAESGLTTALNNEIATRVAGDAKTLGAATAYTDASITNEATLRASGDITLQGNITALQNSLAGYAQTGVSNKFAASQIINGDLAVSNVNASGLLTANGALIPAVQQATPAQGFPSNPFDLAASLSDGTNSHDETFRWQAVPIDNGTPNFAAQLSLLYGGGITPTPTGFSFNADGTQNFVPNQIFNGTHSGDGSGLKNVTAVSANTANTAGFATNAAFSTAAGTANSAITAANAQQLGGLGANAFAQLSASNQFSGDQIISGNLKLNNASSGIVFGDGSVQITAASALGGGQDACFATAAPAACPLVISASSNAPPGYYPLTSSSVLVNSWTSAASIPGSAGISKFGTTVANGKIYLVGGDNAAGSAVNSLAIYDPAQDKWTPGTGMYRVETGSGFTRHVPIQRDALAAATVDELINSKVYAIGGYTVDFGIKRLQGMIQTFDPSAPAGQEWTTFQPSTLSDGPGAELAAVTLNGKIYILGGLKPDSSHSNTLVASADVEVLQPDASNAQGFSLGFVTPMPTARAGLAAAQLNGVVYAIGGYSATFNSSSNTVDIKILDVVEAYDASTNSWTAVAPLPKPTQFPAATALNGQIYVTGGDGGGSNKVWTYSPSTNAWIIQKSIPSPTGSFHGPGLGAVTLNDQLYTFGGLTAENERYVGTETTYSYVRVCTGQGQTICGLSCTDPTTDTNNCGGCGNVCFQPSNGVATCATGSCAGFTCNSGYSQCSNSCVNLQADPNNCGACGTTCAGATLTCVNGSCFCTVPNTVCGGSCTNLQTDPNNCGACGNVCSSSVTCYQGSCQLGGPNSVCSQGSQCLSGVCNIAFCQ